MPPKRRQASALADEKPTKKSKMALGFDLQWHEIFSAHEQPSKKNVPVMLYLSSQTEPGRTKVAAFDIDWTVIATKSGQQFSKNGEDWKWLFESVPTKLKQLHSDGYRVLFFTNQAGIEKGRAKAEDIKEKVEGIISALAIPVFAFVCTGENHYRKPSSAMWDYFLKHCNQGVKVNLDQSLFVGDAAGRPKDWAPGKKKDFSCSDRKFGANIGLKFQTPEEFFLDAKSVKFDFDAFNPTEYLQKASAGVDTSKDYHSKSQEMVILMGMPASGKSTFAETYLVPHKYVHINRDTLGTPAKCVKLTEESLKQGKSVVIDNTNPNKASRAEYVKLAKATSTLIRCMCALTSSSNHLGNLLADVPVRCIILDTPADIAHHLNYVRQNVTDGKVRRIPDVGYNVYKSRLEEPLAAEGFTEIVKIPFQPLFASATHREQFSKWT